MKVHFQKPEQGQLTVDAHDLRVLRHDCETLKAYLTQEVPNVKEALSIIEEMSKRLIVEQP